MPKQVTLRLASELREGQRVALLEFEADGGAPSGCDSVGQLQIDTAWSETQLAITIRGYDLTTHTDETEICTGDYRPARKEVPLTASWLGEDINRKVSIRLRASSSSFFIRHEDRWASLVVRSATNVELDRRPGSAPAWDRRTLSVGMFPADVGILRAFGSTQDELSEFCVRKSWRPAEEVYEGSRQHQDAQRLFVVVRNRAIPGGPDGERVGTLQTSEGRQPVVLSDTRRLEAT